MMNEKVVHPGTDLLRIAQIQTWNPSFKLDEDDCALILAMNGGSPQSPRFRSRAFPFAVCVPKGSSGAIDDLDGLTSGFIVAFKPQLVNQEFMYHVPMNPDRIGDAFLRRDAELMHPFIYDLGLTKELTANEAEFAYLLIGNAGKLCASRDDPYWSSRSRSYFLEALYLLLSAKRPARHSVNGKAMQVRDYIHAHYQDKMTLDYLADQFGTNRTTLQHLFKDEFGMNVFEYISAYRLRRAKELMRDTELTIKEISYLVGFRDYSNFFREFSKHSGLSPINYRKGSAELLIS